MKNLFLLSIFLAILQTLTYSYELYSIEKVLGKHGLHRDLITKVKFRIDDEWEFEECSFVFIENVTRDNYIYLEEVKNLVNFTFWPDDEAMDIEKPASVSQGQEFIWRLPFSEIFNEKSTYISRLDILEQEEGDRPRPQFKYLNLSNPQRLLPKKYSSTEAWNIGGPIVEANVRFEYHMRY